MSIAHWVGLLVLALVSWTPGALTANPQPDPQAAEREAFGEAWRAARSGRRERFDELGPSLEGYVLYPYWQYEDFRHRRAHVEPAVMAAFLEHHDDWAFARGLRTAWLRTLGKQGRWEALALPGEGNRDTEVRCYVARACDPLFAWFIDGGGVTPELAWERIRLAMAAGNAGLTDYLARFLPKPDRDWLGRWQRLDRDRYRRLDRATAWTDQPLARMIAAESLRRLARLDAERALELYRPLAAHFSWDDELAGDLAREVGLWAAVALDDGAINFIHQVPPGSRNDQLHEWWARAAIARGDWREVIRAIDGLDGEAADDDRWAYWQARAQLATGDAEAGLAGLQTLAQRTNYFGFLAADALRLPYTICPREPTVDETEIDALASTPAFHRALELHRVDLDNWAAVEWSNASRALPTERLKVAAGLARREGWFDRVIFALGDSGEYQYYDWRFPIVHTDAIMETAGRYDLEPAWVLGIMRSESAMVEWARSSANALGLMQVTPATAQSLSRKHGLPYRSSSQLLQGDVNIRFGSVYLRDLLNDFEQNPVLVSGAYNAGPNAVGRWLDSRRLDEAARWIETLPYYETRDYIPRVLTFTTLYDWRLRNPVRRITSRMPGIESGTLSLDETTEVVCRPAATEVAVRSP